MAKANWRGFYGRALRDALKIGSLDASSKIGTLIAIQLIIAAGIWIMAGLAGLASSAPTRIMTTLAPLILSLLWFLWRAFSLGPIILAELDRERRGEAGNAERDIALAEGLGWIVFKEWGRTAPKDGGGRLDQFSNAAFEFRQAAVDGKVRAWGSSTTYGILEEIHASFWTRNQIKILSVFNPDEGAELTTEATVNWPLQGADGIRFRLMVSRQEFEAAWPR